MQSVGPGDRVICVDARLAKNPWHRKYPLVRGRVYEIVSVDTKKPELHVTIDSSKRLWEISRFRPLRRVKTDISFAYKILNGVREDSLDEQLS